MHSSDCERLKVKSCLGCGSKNQCIYNADGLLEEPETNITTLLELVLPTKDLLPWHFSILSIPPSSHFLSTLLLKLGSLEGAFLSSRLVRAEMVYISGVFSTGYCCKCSSLRLAEKLSQFFLCPAFFHAFKWIISCHRF